jgi:hypothetical protein
VSGRAATAPQRLFDRSLTLGDALFIRENSSGYGVPGGVTREFRGPSCFWVVLRLLGLQFVDDYDRGDMGGLEFGLDRRAVADDDDREFGGIDVVLRGSFGLRLGH